MKTNRLNTYVLLDQNGKLTQTLVRRQHPPKAGRWVLVTGGCCPVNHLGATVPTSASITSSGFVVNYPAITGADYYIVQRSTAADFSANKNTQITTALTLTYTGLTTATAYYTRVKAVDTTKAKQDGDWSTSLLVTTS